MKKFTNGIDQEHIIEQLRPTTIFAFMSIFPLVLLSFTSMIFAIMFINFLIILSLLTAIYAWYRFLYIINIQYTVTQESITVRTGLIARRFDNLELYRVKDYVVKQSVAMRIFGIMTVTLFTTDLTSDTVSLQGIPLSNITEKIRGLVQIARINNRIFEVN